MEKHSHFEVLLQNNLKALLMLQADNQGQSKAIKALNICQDLECLHDAVSNRPESNLLKLGIREYHLALYQATIANYRNAFSALRLSAELLFGSIYFSAFEIKYRRWKMGAEDIVWKAMLDRETGVLSTQFIMAFDKEFVEAATSYLRLSEKAYRECSEYVHGNSKTHAEDGVVLYHADLFDAWIDKSESILLAFFYAFAARHLRYLEASKTQSLSDLMRDRFGHLTAIQLIYP